jgi:hypothetical protein
MRFSKLLVIPLLAAVCVDAQESAPAKIEKKGIPPRAAPTDYQAHADASSLTVAAEFHGHTIPTMEGLLTSEEYIVVEAALFGPTGSKTKLALEDFSLRINGKKNPLPSQSDVLVFKSVKDPEWEPPVKVEKGGKTSIGGGGKGGQGDAGGLPPVVHVPLELQRAWSQRVQKAAIAEGDRELPLAGLIFFRYGGKTKGLTLELIYSGPGGKATLALEPE